VTLLVEETPPAGPEHLHECDGNGSVLCWQCGGEGVVGVSEDDCDGWEDEPLIACDECEGRGFFVCPGCETMLPPDEAP
jgi:hypothetical protein